jgi:hypothetical protein
MGLKIYILKVEISAVLTGTSCGNLYMYIGHNPSVPTDHKIFKVLQGTDLSEPTA